MKKLIIILICIIFCCSSAAFAKEKDTTLTPLAKNIVHVELAGLAYSYFISINYERIFVKWFSIRFGYGYSKNEKNFLLLYNDGAFHGMNAMINFHTTLKYTPLTGNNKINVGAGVSFLYDHNRYRPEWNFWPSLCVTYRYQPIEGGVYFSIGYTIAYASGGISIGIGRVF